MCFPTCLTVFLILLPQCEGEDDSHYEQLTLCSTSFIPLPLPLPGIGCFSQHLQLNLKFLQAPRTSSTSHACPLRVAGRLPGEEHVGLLCLSGQGEATTGGCPRSSGCEAGWCHERASRGMQHGEGTPGVPHLWKMYSVLKGMTSVFCFFVLF